MTRQTVSGNAIIACSVPLTLPVCHPTRKDAGTKEKLAIPDRIAGGKVPARRGFLIRWWVQPCAPFLTSSLLRCLTAPVQLVIHRAQGAAIHTLLSSTPEKLKGVDLRE